MRTTIVNVYQSPNWPKNINILIGYVFCVLKFSQSTDKKN